MNPNDLLNTLLTPESRPFPETSRYSGVEITTLETAAGETVAYLRRRFVPAPEKLALLTTHTVVLGDRLDQLAAQHLGDAEQFWRLCDANGALRPEALVEHVGRRLRITLPEGMPGVDDG
jgi:hypothetical protein